MACRPLPPPKFRSAGLCAALVAALAAWPVRAQTSAPAPDPPASAAAQPGDGDTAPAPLPVDASTGAGEAAICTDRPTKSNYACTVEAGRFQYETDLANVTVQHQAGVTTDTVLVVNPTLKYGLTSDLDLEANISPFESVRTTQANGTQTTVSGISDLYLRVKYEFLNIWSGNLQAALLPYVKVPTARLGIGNGEVEEGMYLPVNYKINGIFTLTTVPEVDYLLDATGAGRHLNTAQLINLAASIPDNVTLYAELWGDWNFDPSGLKRQYSADAAVAYGVTSRLQLDLGVNAGLNRYTPAAQVYIGVSQKF